MDQKLWGNEEVWAKHGELTTSAQKGGQQE
jgi:hypothetical protein